jgi:hypothetical protein
MTERPPPRGFLPVHAAPRRRRRDAAPDIQACEIGRTRGRRSPSQKTMCDPRRTPRRCARHSMRTRRALLAAIYQVLGGRLTPPATHTNCPGQRSHKVTQLQCQVFGAGSLTGCRGAWRQRLSSHPGSTQVARALSSRLDPREAARRHAHGARCVCLAARW